MERKNTTPYIDDIIKKYIKNANEFYPGFEFGSRFSMYNGDEPRSCKFEFRFNSHNLVKTEYQIKKKIDLIHYNSNIQNIFEIVNSGLFRLSNLIALNDPQELNYITKDLKMEFNNSEIETYKQKIFTTSFCKVINNGKPDDFAMWRLYGGDGLGAAIIFEIVNPKKVWSNFLLANVQYGECKSVERFKNFMDFHKAFQAENNNPIQNLPNAFPFLMALHKNKIWGTEKEVRLLTHHDFDKYSFENNTHHICNLKHSISRDGSVYSYVELPLYNGKEYNRITEKLKELDRPEFLLDSFPIFKIKKILLGYRLSSKVVDNAIDVANHISKNYKYNILIGQSPLRRQMI